MKTVSAIRVCIVSIVVLSLSLLLAPAAAQDTTVTVPDVSGLGVPQAAALLNLHGLRLGEQTNMEWSEDAGYAANTISAQAVGAGSEVAPGTSIDVTVLRSPNVTLQYRRNQIALINGTGAPLDLTRIRFEALDGNGLAAFDAGTWDPTLAAGNRCVQLWAVRRTGPDRPPDCEGIQNWLSTVNTAVHFWTETNGVTQFRVLQDGVERAVCGAAVEGGGLQECSFFIANGAAADDVTAYIYLAYTTDRLIVFNQSTDKWMALGQTSILNYNPNLAQAGIPLTVGDPALFGDPDIVANIRRLAPGQCLLYTNRSPDVTGPPQDCAVIARLDLDPTLIFWAADFEIASATDGQRHKCLAAREGALTICVMPR
ncbi:MAG: PASTA domain-containing protein [Anaerolineae bacterium]|nr:PASTA domain-containing protein [Anaerolineae bacterium]